MAEAQVAPVSGDLTQPASRIEAVCAIDIEPRPVEWLWPGRIPARKITVLDGSPGLAKTTIAVDLAARLTSSRPMPDGSRGTPGAVILVSYEDDAADTLVPRFLAAGGDPQHLFLADTIDTDHGPRPLEIPDDIEHLEILVRSKNAVLLVVDPLMAALGVDVRSGIDHHIRRALAPLRAMAERTGVAVVLIRHLNKAVTVTDPVMRGGGSIGIIGAARAGLIVARDPDDQDRRLLAVSKLNVGRDDAPALAYRVATDPERNVGVIEWLGHSTKTARDLLEAPGEDRGARSEAAAVLAEFLEDGPKLATEAKAYAKEAGIAARTLDRAKDRLGVAARPRTGEDGKSRWWWSLPQHKEERQ